MTRERTPGVVVIEKRLIESQAYRRLSGKAPQVLTDFLGKRQLKKKRGRDSRREEWVITNNGNITYTYEEAQKRGMSRPAFVRALDNLIDHGFLDIAQTGAGLFKSCTLYALSERWKSWGTSEFVAKPRPKRKGQMGFHKGHRLSPNRKKASNGSITGSSNGNMTGSTPTNNGSVTASQGEAVPEASNEIVTVL
jgi:hypothetical protein